MAQKWWALLLIVVGVAVFAESMHLNARVGPRGAGFEIVTTLLLGSLVAVMAGWAWLLVLMFLAI